MDPENSQDAAAPTRIADRYRVVRALGRGGMATVYECVDEQSGQTLAIKRLHAHRASGDGHLARLFEQEFHTLTQLAHPRVVAVHDYQRLEDGAFYSMELLSGGDLQQLRGMPWKEACALLCDVCSALSLLHSRRFVHRDVTPANVRRTEDGKAKLIDFGAMVPFGTHKRTVGTPAFTSPEAVTGQPLDGRADLYSLGATAYFVLTGRHAYPARTFANLRNAWRTRPPLPSRIVPDIPPELDQLVMSLLELAPTRRPSTASAVIERLTAITGLQLGELPQVQLSFLSTPSLVGRGAMLARIRRHMIQAARGRGFALLLQGASGAGRSRMLDACALEAKLASALVLRADAADGQDGEWGGVRALLDQLAAELPSEAPALFLAHTTALNPIWPRVNEIAGVPPSNPPAHQQRADAQTALLQVMLAALRYAFVVIAVDDVDRLDEPSAAFIALLAQQLTGRRLAVVASAHDDAAGGRAPALQLLRRDALSEAIEPLSHADTEALLVSVFGEVPHVRLLAKRLHDAANGMPAAIMALSQHLLDQNVVRYADGGWILPSKLDPGAFPKDIGDALQERLAALDRGSLELARAIALYGKPAVTAEECERLLGQADWAGVLHGLDALVQAQLLRLAGGRYVVAFPGWTELALAGLDPAESRKLHARVAALYARQPGASVLTARHLLVAGDADGAVDVLLHYLRTEGPAANQDPRKLQQVVRNIPADWVQTLEAAVAAADRLGRPVRERIELRSLFLQHASVMAEPRTELVNELVEHLYRDSGLRDHTALGETVPEPQRLQQALQQAQARHDATPEADRGFSPSEAIPELARCVTRIMGLMGASADSGFMRALPSLMPLAPLSPALYAVQHNLDSTCYLLSGQLAQARQIQLALLDRMAAPEGIGLAPAIHHYMELAVTYAVALTETIGGLPRALERAARLQRDPLYEVNAWRLRMLWALKQGDVEGARLAERQAELLQIRNAPPQFFEGGMVFFEAMAYADIGDVAGVRNTLERLEAMAAKFPHRHVSLLSARAYVVLLRGEPEAAAGMFGEALATSAAGELMSWAPSARGYLSALAACGQVKEARERGAVLLRQAADAGLTVQIAELHFAMAEVELAGGDYSAALLQLASVAEIRERWPGGEVFGGACSELRARIALAMGDEPAFVSAATRCAKHFLPSRNPMLVARHQRLLQDAERAQIELPAGVLPSAHAQDTVETAALSTVATTNTESGSVFAACDGLEERVARALALATEHDHTRRAMLYLLQGSQLSWVGRQGECPDPARMAPMVAEFMQGEIEGASTTIDPDDLVTSTVDEAQWSGPDGVQFAPALLSHPTPEGIAITGVLVFDVDGRHPEDALLARLSAAFAGAGDAVPRDVATSSDQRGQRAR